MKVILPLAGKNCSGVSVSDFDKYPIPVPPCTFEESEKDLILSFKDAEEAVKYALHLGDVYERMKGNTEHDCSRKKIKLIISGINDQTDFGSLSF